MKKKAVSGIMLTLLLISMSTLAFSIEQVSALESPYIAVIPNSIIDPTLTPGKNFTVSIYTDYTGSDIWGWQFTLAYNSSIIHGVVVNGDLITTDKHPDALFKAGDFNNTLGKLWLTSAFFFYTEKPIPTTYGPGILANVTFTVVGTGDSDITIVESVTKLIGYNAITEVFYEIVSDWKPDIGHILHGYFSNIDGLPPPAITATVNIKPNSLNLKNKGQRITAYIKLPESYDVGDIDVSTILLNNTIPAISSRVTGNKLMVRFDRAEVMALLSVGEATLTITGEVDESPFEGSDTIRVIFPSRRCRDRGRRR